jgi:hypothetical protein
MPRTLNFRRFWVIWTRLMALVFGGMAAEEAGVLPLMGDLFFCCAVRKNAPARKAEPQAD